MSEHPALAIDLEQVVDKLSRQIGSLHVEIAMRDVALAAAQARIAELTGATEEDAG